MGLIKKSYLLFLQKIEGQVQALMSDNRVELKQAGEYRTIFQELIYSDIPAEEKSMTRMIDEGMTLIGAGTITTAHVLSTTAYHILANPEVLQTLKHELQEVMPDGSEVPTKTLLAQLEHLPYLTAIITEGLRVANTIVRRNPRVAPGRSLQFQHWTIPPGTAVSMTVSMVNMNPTIFPDPEDFRPERWLPGVAESGVPSKKYHVPFGRGSRMCLGMNLAYAELYLTLAAVFRRFDLELFETTKADVEIVHDFLAGTPRLDSKGVRVLVSKSQY
jgi:cytochrome P450